MGLISVRLATLLPSVQPMFTRLSETAMTTISMSALLPGRECNCARIASNKMCRSISGGNAWAKIPV